MTIRKVRSGLYRAARILGDVEAVQKGPRAIEKRVMRRAAGRVSARTLWKLFK